MARNLEKVTEQPDNEGQITAFMGVGHIAGVKRYLEHPSFRKLKRAIYSPIDLMTREPVTKLDVNKNYYSIAKQF